MKLLRPALVGLVFIGAARIDNAVAATAPAEVVAPAAIEAALEHAYLRGDSAAVSTAEAQVDAALARDPHSAQLGYLKGFAHFAAGRAVNRTTSKPTVIAEFEAAADALATVQGEPWQSEARALEGAICGQLISLKGGMSAMTLGPKAGQLTADAAARLPDSPRVRLFRAQILEHTPAMFGGDVAAAAKLYQQAVDAFASGEKGSGPRWGYADALTWLGLSRQAADDEAGARTAWERALQIEPDDHYVKFALLPRLQQKTAP